MNEETQARHLLVVEDDLPLARSLASGLRDAGFAVTLCHDGDEASAIMQRERFGLGVLDLMLPGKSGELLLEEWQARSQAPVIVLTAKSELSDRLRCFDLGAVDYLPKPFFVEELLVRIRLRLQLQEEAPARCIRWCDVVVDLDGRSVEREGQVMALVRSEFNVLAYLLEREGRALSRDQIADNVLTVSDEPVNPRTVDGYIARLRSKLGPEAGACLHTVWGIGYRFQRPEPDGQEP